MNPEIKKIIAREGVIFVALMIFWLVANPNIFAESIGSDEENIRSLILDLASKVDKGSYEEVVASVQDGQLNKQLVKALRDAKIKDTYNATRLKINNDVASIDYQRDIFTNKPLEDTFMIELKKVNNKWIIKSILLVD